MHWVTWNTAVSCCSAHRECSVNVGNRIEWTNSFSGLPWLHTFLFSYTPPSAHRAPGSEDPSCSYRVNAVLGSIRSHFLLCQVHPRGLTVLRSPSSSLSLSFLFVSMEIHRLGLPASQTLPEILSWAGFISPLKPWYPQPCLLPLRVNPPSFTASFFFFFP